MCVLRSVFAPGDHKDDDDAENDDDHDQEDGGHDDSSDDGNPDKEDGDGDDMAHTTVCTNVTSLSLSRCDDCTVSKATMVHDKFGDYDDDDVHD